MSSNIKPSPRKFQESASAVLRNMAPMLAKARSLTFKKLLMPSPEVNRASQQTELLKWQQDMFHRVLNTMCLVQDNLLDASELVAVREHIIRTLIAVHPDGEWAEFTRDKLLFLQDLYHARCISEEEYHTAKQPLLERLAEQGAQLGTQDFEFKWQELKEAVDSRLAANAAPSHREDTSEVGDPQPATTADSGSAKKKTPIKHVMDAMARLTTSSAKKRLDLSYSDDKHTREEAKSARVPHALDFLRPPECPTRDPPATPANPKRASENWESPLFKYSNAGTTSRAPFPQLSSDTTDLLPQLSSLTLNDFESPPSVPASPGPATQTKPALSRSNSLTPSKLSFTPRSALTPGKSSTPSKSPLGLNHSGSRRLPLSASPASGRHESLSRKFSGLLRGWQKVEAEAEVLDSEDDEGEETSSFHHVTPKKNLWQKLDLRGGSSKRVDDDDDFGKEISEKDPLLSAIEDYPAEKVKSGFINGQGPNVRKLKKKVDVRAAPTNFFIDQVLGENIKAELERIRRELAGLNPGHQTFTNEQIDAIATRLPVDKNELMRFFPKAWCDKYGDVVLEVVHKEFKGHVSEMDGLRKASKEKRRSRLTSKHQENDENRKSTDSSQTTESIPSPKKQPSLQRSTSTKPPVTRVYTTEGSDFKAASVHEQPQSFSTVSLSPPSGGRARRGLAYEELDSKLGAEILRMPFRNFNETTRYH